MADLAKTPSVEEEAERLKKWREVRRQAAADPQTDRLANASMDREKRLELFEADKSRRIREADDRRRAEADALETRRMEKARVHLDALDDIETAKARLLASRRKSRRLTLAALAACVGLPTLLTAIYYAFVATPIYHSSSVLSLAEAIPVTQRNPLFNEVSPHVSSSMAAAFQLRAELKGRTNVPPFEMAIDSQQGLIVLTTVAVAAADAATLNQRIISHAKMLTPALTTLAYPSVPTTPISRTFNYSLLAFLISLSIFAIGAIFLQSLLHHSRN